MYGVRNVNVFKLKPDNKISELSAFSFVPKCNINSNKNITTNIIGKFQYLKEITHPNLCQYINITKNRKDRLFVVSEYFENSLESHLKECKKITNISRIRKLTFQILSALMFINSHGIINRNLSLKNILLDFNNNVKLDNWGFYDFTNKGKDVQFPIGNPEFYAPEIIKHHKCNLKADTWALGIILIYIYIGHLPFNVDSNLFLEELFEAILSIKKVNNENDSHLTGKKQFCGDLLSFFEDELKEENEDIKIFKDFVLTCLEPDSKKRPTPSDLLCHEFVKELNENSNEGDEVLSPIFKKDFLFSEMVKDIIDNENENSIEKSISNITRYKNIIADEDFNDLELEKLQPRVIFYLWKLAGGDLEYEFIKQELISLPSIYRVKNASQVYYTLNDNQVVNAVDINNSFQQVSDPENLYQEKKILLSIDYLISQFNEYKKFNKKQDYLIDMLNSNNNNYFISKNGISQEKEMTFNEFMKNNNNDVIDFWNSSESIKNNEYISKYDEINKVIDNNDKQSNKEGEIKANVELSYNSSVLDKDIVFQYGRIKLFDRLLNQFPSSWNEFIQEAKIHISPYLRGKIWAAILGVTGDSKVIYNSLCEKCDLIYNDSNINNSNLELERQLEADIPRCHQYNDLLSSDIGHNKLKRVIKCWNIAESGNLVYWQGLDSVCAPFVALNFNEEEIAFSCLLKFIKNYMYGLFKIDNSYYIRSYLIAMSHIISYHDPELGSYLKKINLTPDIYAIPWFMTMFTHVFPLDKIYMIWDKILIGKPSLPLFIGSAIVIQLRSEILNGDFDESVLLLTELSAINIDKCLEKAQLLLRMSPKSIVPDFLNIIDSTKISNDNLDDIVITEDLDTLHSDELAPRIKIEDFKKMYNKSLILDVRNESLLTQSEDNGYIVISPSGSFLQGHIKNSISIPYYENDILPTSLINYIKILNKDYQYVVVVGEEERAIKLAEQLITECIQRVSYLNENNINKETFESWEEPDIWCCKKPESEKFYIDDNSDDAKSLDIARNLSPISPRSFNSDHPFENTQTFIIYKCQ
ncbi:hypothetical protein BCR36DRAFT_338798 [Piromyces finnis]|uniref:TBC-domain-containing protein n=1 Tax=Piromyces finnis TaxID=1754191 RepID=A0A1Y1UX03_9FUNG|nr:hypothetical protein BCR36DRAFT_338798 [Piromyces finnis]|eukprot:ORX41747.1 hypothetical protein BCR36DRAFT_338798 [Piromyces finnis]